MNDTKNTKIKDVLIKAKQLIKEKGWTQKAYHDEKGYCMAGAIGEASNQVSNEIYVVITEKMNSVCGDAIVTYNDKLGRTKEEVLLTFDKAIASCSQETG